VPDTLNISRTNIMNGKGTLLNFLIIRGKSVQGNILGNG